MGLLRDASDVDNGPAEAQHMYVAIIVETSFVARRGDAAN